MKDFCFYDTNKKPLDKECRNCKYLKIVGKLEFGCAFDPTDIYLVKKNNPACEDFKYAEFY